MGYISTHCPDCNTPMDYEFSDREGKYFKCYGCGTWMFYPLPVRLETPDFS